MICSETQPVAARILAEATTWADYQSDLATALSDWTPAESAAWENYVASFTTAATAAIAASGTASYSPGSTPPSLPDGATVDPSNGFVYDAQRNLMGLLNSSGYLYWPLSWPPGGSTPTITPSPPNVATGILQPYARVVGNYRGRLQTRVGTGTVTVLTTLPP